MKLKKVTAILLTAVMTAALAACGSSSGSSGDDAGGSGTYTIGICQQMEHAALDALVDRISNETPIDELMIRRLKKRRLALRDFISRLEAQLDPQEPA